MESMSGRVNSRIHGMSELRGNKHVTAEKCSIYYTLKSTHLFSQIYVHWIVNGCTSYRCRCRKFHFKGSCKKNCDNTINKHKTAQKISVAKIFMQLETEVAGRFKIKVLVYLSLYKKQFPVSRQIFKLSKLSLKLGHWQKFEQLHIPFLHT